MEEINVISQFGKNHYDQYFPGIPVLYEDTYFVQFDAFILYLPATGSTGNKNSLDIFEETVLRLLSISDFTTQNLSERLCLQEDFLEYVLQRLRELHFVSEQTNVITDGGKSYLGLQSTTKLGEFNTNALSPYYVPVRRDTGEILPLLLSRNALKKGNADFSTHKVTVVLGNTAGTEESLIGKIITVKQTHNKKRISQQKIRQILRVYRRYAEELISLPDDEIMIEASFEPNLYLQVKVIVQEGKVDNILASAGNFTHTPELLAYLEDNRLNFKTKILKNAQIRTENNNQVSPTISNKKYKNIIRFLKSPQDELLQNSDELQLAAIQATTLIRGYVAAIEWALDAYLRQIPISKSLLQIMRSQDAITNGQTLFSMGKQADIKGLERVKSLFKLVPWRVVEDWRKAREPSLSLLFPIAVGMQFYYPQGTIRLALIHMGEAAKSVPPEYDIDTNKKNHRRIRWENNDGTEILERLYNYANTLRHGKKWKPVAGDSLVRLFKATKAFIQTLLPDFKLDEHSIQPKLTRKGYASEKNIDAMVWLLDTFGETLYANLSKQVINGLRQASDISSVIQIPEKTSIFLEGLSSAVEEELKSRINININLSPKNVICHKLEVRKALPFGLSKVAPRYYERAINGQVATLGAYTLAWAAGLSDEELQDAIDRKLFVFINDLADARGHGTAWRDFQAEELQSLRTKAVAIIKYLEEKNHAGE